MSGRCPGPGWLVLIDGVRSLLQQERDINISLVSAKITRSVRWYQDQTLDMSILACNCYLFFESNIPGYCEEAPDNKAMFSNAGLSSVIFVRWTWESGWNLEQWCLDYMIQSKQFQRFKMYICNTDTPHKHSSLRATFNEWKILLQVFFPTSRHYQIVWQTSFNRSKYLQRNRRAYK